MTTIWILLLLAPSESAGHQIGPFATQAQCLIVERAYNARSSHFMARCVEVMK